MMRLTLLLLLQVLLIFEPSEALQLLRRAYPSVCKGLYTHNGKTSLLMARRRTTLGKSPNNVPPKKAPSDEYPGKSSPADTGNADSLVVLKTIDWESQPVFKTSGGSSTSTASTLPEGFQSDLDDFRLNMSGYQSQIPPIGRSPPPSGTNSIVESLKSAVTALLIADFFVVIVFLVWFLAAAALQSSYPVVLERFQDVFQPVVVPALTVLMVGSIASGALESAANRDKADS